MRGGDLGKIVPSAILQKIAAATYAKVKGQEPPANIGDWFLFDASNTLLLYSLNSSVNKTILCVIGVRGTVTGTDWEANITIPFNGLEDTTRYIEDAEKVEEWQERIAKMLPGYDVLYAAVGHSLGGAICDDFLREGLVESALTFNSAIETKNLGMAHEGFDIKRVYAHGDPLHDLFGRHSDPPPLMLDFGDVNEILRHEPGNVIEFFKAKLNKHYLKTFNDVGQGDDPLMLGKGKKNLCGMGVGRKFRGGGVFEHVPALNWERAEGDAAGRPELERPLKDIEAGMRALSHITKEPTTAAIERLMADSVFEVMNPQTGLDAAHKKAEEMAIIQAFRSTRQAQITALAALNSMAEKHNLTGQEGRKLAYQYINEPNSEPGGKRRVKEAKPKVTAEEVADAEAEEEAERRADEERAAAKKSAEETAAAPVKGPEASPPLGKKEAKKKAAAKKKAEEAAKRAAEEADEEALNESKRQADAERAEAAKKEAEANAKSKAKVDAENKAAAERQLDFALNTAREQYVNLSSVLLFYIEEYGRQAKAGLKKEDPFTMPPHGTAGAVKFPNYHQFRQVISAMTEESDSLKREADKLDAELKTLRGKGKKGGMLHSEVEELNELVSNSPSETIEQWTEMLEHIWNALEPHDRTKAVDRELTRLQTEGEELFASGESGDAQLNFEPLYDLLLRQERLHPLRTARNPDMKHRTHWNSPKGYGKPNRKHTLALLMGEGNQHKPFPYSRSDLAEDKKAIERSRHYRALDKARRFGINPPKEHQEMAAVRGLKPKRETTPKEGSERKPYVGAKMKRDFLKTHSATELKAAVRTYKKGGVSWESLM